VEGDVDEREVLRIKHLMGKYFEHLEMENYSPTTIETYRSHLNPFLRFLADRGDVENLSAVTGETLHQYQMEVHGERIRGRPMTVATHCHRLVAVRSLFRYLARRGAILSDPAGCLELPRLPETLPRRVLTVREMEKILRAPDVDRPLGLRDRAIMELLYSTGIRNAELRALNVGDVDPRNNQVHVTQGKGRRDRVLPLGEIAGSYVERYLEDARPTLTKGWEPTAALFVNHQGRRLGDCGLIYCVVGRYARAAKLAGVTPHVFRHTCATHMLKGRANIRHIQELLGHRSLTSTQRYTRLEITDLKREHRRCHPRERTK
jgi:integrase/recombinase XerD